MCGSNIIILLINIFPILNIYSDVIIIVLNSMNLERFREQSGKPLVDGGGGRLGAAGERLPSPFDPSLYRSFCFYPRFKK